MFRVTNFLILKVEDSVNSHVWHDKHKYLVYLRKIINAIGVCIFTEMFQVFFMTYFVEVVSEIKYLLMGQAKFVEDSL